MSLSLALADAPASEKPRSAPSEVELRNEFVKIRVSDAGVWSLSFTDGTGAVLENVRFRLEAGEAEGNVGDYIVRLSKEHRTDDLGEFERAVMHWDGRGVRPDIDYSVSLNTREPELIVELDYLNRTGEEKRITAVWPMSTDRDDGGLTLPGSPQDWVGVKTEGYYGPHQIVRGISSLENIPSHFVARNAVAERSFLLGFLSHRKGVGSVSLARGEDSRIGLGARVLYAEPSIPVPPGRDIKGEKLLMVFGKNGLENLERLGDLIGLEHGINLREEKSLDERSRFFHTWKNEWASYIMLGRITGPDGGPTNPAEHEALSALGLDKYGYTSPPAGFRRQPLRVGAAPCLARMQGLKDFWAPLSEARRKELRQAHPDWFIQIDPKDAPYLLDFPNPEALGIVPQQELYVFDFSHPEVIEFERERAESAAKRYDIFKYTADFIHRWQYFPQQHDPFQTVPEMLRNAIGVWRDQGAKAWGLAYINRFYLSYGLWDTVRVGMDSDGGYLEPHSGSFLGQCVPMASQRYFFNGRVWWNNPSSYHVYVQGRYSPGEAKVHATFCAFAANILTLGEPLTKEELPPDRLDIIKKISPAGMDVSRPLDYFDRSHPAVWHMPIERPFGSWDLLALFAYWHDKDKSFSIDLAELGLPDAKEYLVYEFWQDSFLGSKKGRLDVDLNGPDCAVYSIVEKKLQPQLVSTNRHVRHMANDILDLAWESASNVLRGKSKVIEGEYYELRIHVPEGFQPQDVLLSEDYTVSRELSGSILRVQFTPAETGEVHWRIGFLRSDHSPS